MSDIWNIIAELGSELHPKRVDALAELVRSVNSGEDFLKIRRKLSPNLNMNLIDLLEKKWKENKEVSSIEVASALVSASLAAELASSRGSVEMVWTGPSSNLVPIRHTEQVLKEVIESARTKLFVVSFVAYNVPSIHDALNKAISRNVAVDILVESSQNTHSKIQVDSVPKLRRAVPKANIYIWDQSQIPSNMIGVVHAKCAVADESIAFITSANLTTAAMEKNVELGVLIRGGDLPTKLDQNLRSLIVSNIFKIVN